MLAVGLAAGCLSTMGAAMGGAAGAEPAPQSVESPGGPSQVQPYALWLHDVAPLIQPEEAAAFEALEDDASREAFIVRFWQVRDPTPETPRNELRDRWRAGAVSAARLDPESRVRRAPQEVVLRLLDARPRLLHTISCEPLPALEVWYFSRRWTPRLAPGAGSTDPFYLLFAQSGEDGAFRQITPAEVDAPWEGGATLRERLDKVVRSKRCLEGVPGAARAVADSQRAVDGALGWSELVAAVGVPSPSPFWYHALEPDPVPSIGEPSLTFSFPGHYGEETVVRGLLELSVLPPDGASPGDARGLDGVVLSGEAIAYGDVRDSFHYAFNALGKGLGERPALTFERSLSPAPYLLELRLEDLRGNLLWWGTRRLVVPEVRQAMASPPVDPSVLDANDLLLVPTDAALSVVVQRAGLLVGEVPVRAYYSGLDAPTVRFYLDRRLVGEVSEPPYELTIDLGKAPKRHVLRAVAVDAAGRTAAEHRTRINDGPHRFAVRLAHPQPGAPVGKVFTARAEVIAPFGVPVDRLELEVNGEPRATLFSPPFVQALALPEGADVVYVRAVAFLGDGRQAEDAVVVRGAPGADEIDVQLVELFTTVLDNDRVPVTDLSRDDFTILDEGEPREIREFRKLDQIPVHVCLAVDASQSMKTVMDTVRVSAIRFLEGVLTPKDEAAVVSFDHRVRLVAPLTTDLTDLWRSVASIEAVGGTALYDAVIMSLHYLGGLEGKRAIVLLSDGHDQHSHFRREDVRELARRSGVAIYTIALGDDRRLWTLKQLARETGGHSFAIRRAEQLTEVYRQIEQELRSQYLLTFQAPEGGGDDYRHLEVKVFRPGVEARTLRGYYRE